MLISGACLRPAGSAFDVVLSSRFACSEALMAPEALKPQEYECLHSIDTHVVVTFDHGRCSRRGPYGFERKRELFSGLSNPSYQAGNVSLVRDPRGLCR